MTVSTSAPTGPDARLFLVDLFKAAIEAACPSLKIPLHLPPLPKGRTIAIGAGKAAASMAAALEANRPGPIEGLVVTRYGHGPPTRRIEVVEAAHPVPDEAGLRAAERILDRIKGLSCDDLVICLLQVQNPIEAGHPFRDEAGRHSDLMSDAVPR